MKRITVLSLLFMFIVSSAVQALEWAYAFVVWNGKVYEVKTEEIVEDSKIGKMIGEVKTQPDETTGEYFGDASNYYPIGTKYYEIKGVPTSTAIAVKEDNHWVKAVYVHRAPFHIVNLLSNVFFISTVIIIALIVTVIIFRTKKTKNL